MNECSNDRKGEENSTVASSSAHTKIALISMKQGMLDVQMRVQHRTNKQLKIKHKLTRLKSLQNDQQLHSEIPSRRAIDRFL